MVLRPVEFYTTADPRSRKSDESGFDHLVVIDEIIAIRFIICPLDPSSYLGKHHDSYILILQKDRGVFLVLFFIIYFLYDRKRIHFPAASLIHAFFKEHGVLIGIADSICGNSDLLFPYPCLGIAHSIHSFSYKTTQNPFCYRNSVVLMIGNKINSHFSDDGVSQPSSGCRWNILATAFIWLLRFPVVTMT